MSDCKLKCVYGEEGLALECTGKLTFFQTYTTNAEFILPTSKAEGRVHFQNFDDALTLEALMEGFNMLTPETCSNPILSKFLDIAVRKVDITLSSSSGHVEITSANVSLYKKELDIKIVKFREIELTVKVKKGNDGYHGCETRLEGECTLNDKFNVKISCACSSGSLELKVNFSSCISPKVIFELLGTGCSASDLAIPVPGMQLEDEVNYEAGFTLAQPLSNTSVAEISSLFFAVRADKINLQQWLPSTVKDVQNVEAFAVIHHPFSESRRTGLRVNFTTNFSGEKMRSLDVSLMVPPRSEEMEYLCRLQVKPCFKPCTEANDITNEAVFESISPFDTEIVSKCAASVSESPELGSQLMSALSLQRCALIVFPGEKVNEFSLEASLSRITFLSEKITMSDCKLKCVYGEEGLALECTGKLTFFQAYTTNAEFILPTSNAEGRVHFQNFDDALTLETLMAGFNMLTPETCSNPILSKFLDIAVRKVDIILSSSSGHVEITAANVSLYKKELDIRVVKFHEIELTVKVKKVNDGYKFYFLVGAYIAESLYAQLEYDPDKRVLKGQVVVALFSAVSAPDTLAAVHVEAVGSRVNSYEDLSVVLQERIMKLFASAKNQQLTPGMAASLDVTVSVPRGRFDRYTLEDLSLQVKDALTIGNFVLDTFVFEYSKTPFSHKDSPSAKEKLGTKRDSTTRLIGTLKKLDSNESSTVEFNLACKRNESSVLTAQLHAGPDGGLVKLSSIIELANCVKPVLPDVGIPPIFDIEVLDGSMVSLDLSPFKVSALDVKVAVSNWMVFNDPELTIHELVFQLKWSSGCSPELSFKGTLTFVNMCLSLEGKVSENEVLVECKHLVRSSEDKLDFQEALNKYTVSGSQPLEIPQHIDLPPVVVNLKNLKIHLQKCSNLFHFNGQLVARDPWCIGFGARVLEVHSIGAVLEWEKELGSSARCSAFIYGSMKFLNFRLDVQMQLGNERDCIIAGIISNPESFHYDQIADFLTASPDGTIPQEPNFSELVPAKMESITTFRAAAALNITRRQFFFSGQVDQFGAGSLFVGHFSGEKQMKYILSLTLESGFKFSMLSEKLAFIDEAVTIRSVNLVVSTVNSCTLSDILKPYQQSFTQLASELQPQQPFATLPGLKHQSKLLSGEVRKGMTLYAEIDIPACRRHDSLLYNIFRLGDDRSEIPDIILKVSITQDPSEPVKTTTPVQKSACAHTKQFELQAWIHEIILLGRIKFSDIELMYQLPKGTLKLSGEVLIDFDHGKLHFLGSLLISALEAKFEASSTQTCRDVISRPAGFNVTVRDLKLELLFDLSPDNRKAPLITISGEIDFASTIVLKAFVLLKGISFRVFYICLAQGLSLSVLFERSNINWPVSSLDIAIKEGEFYYARKNTVHRGTTYDDGFHMKALITFLNSDFRVGADVSHDRSRLRMWGQCVGKIDLFFAKLTDEDFQYGPMLEYSSQDAEQRISLRGGVELLGCKLFRGSISYLPRTSAFEGTISYPGSILWFSNPTMKVSWSKEDGFQIVDFSLDGGTEFDLLSALRTFAKILLSLVTGIITWKMKLTLKTGKNPNPDKYLVTFILTGSLAIRLLSYFDIDFFPLPEIPINIPRFKNFSFEKLPYFLIQCLWESAGDICKSLLNYINPWELAKRMGKMIVDSLKGIVTKVVDLGKKVVEGVKSVGRAIKRGWKWLFGGSAYILDDQNDVVAYIYGGKGGRALQDEKYVVQHFGPFLAVRGVEKIATDIHSTGKACIDVPDEVKGDNITEGHKDDEEVLNRETLRELKESSQELERQLERLAHEMLEAANIEVVIMENGTQLKIHWQVCSSDGETVYTEDKGDIDHHVKVTATVIDHPHNPGSSPQIHTETIFDEILTRPKDSNDVWPSLLVNIDPSILLKAINIGVNIHPSVTMRVKAILSGDPIHINQEQVEADDKSWMNEAKARFEQEGRIKEVTLSGRPAYKELMIRPSSTLQTEVHITAKCNYLEQEVSCTITPVQGAQWYLLEVIDNSDRAIVIAQKLVSSELQADAVSQDDTEAVITYSIKLPDLSDPTSTELEASRGPYIVTAIGLTSDFETSWRSEAPDLQLSRHSTPEIIDQVFPNLNRSENDTVKVTWTLSDSDISKWGEYILSLVGSQPLEKQAHTDPSRSDDVHMSTFVILEQSVFPSHENTEELPKCHYEFKLKEVMKEKGVTLDKPLTLYCAATKAGSSGKLPSIPKKASKVTVLAAPARFKCSLPDGEAGLMVSWPYSCHALSYRFEFIDNSTGGIVLPRPRDHHYGQGDKSKAKGCDVGQGGKSKVKGCDVGQGGKSKVKDCDVDRFFVKDDLKHLSHNSPEGYRLQVYALGFGDELLKSPFPKQAEETIHVLPVDLEYMPQSDTLKVKFANDKATKYLVELYQGSGNRMHTIERKTVNPACSNVEFTPKQWRSKIHPGCIITGWVTAADHDPTINEDSGHLALSIGVSSTELLVLPAPECLWVRTVYSSKTIVRNMSLEWPQSEFTCEYEYGLCNSETGRPVLKHNTLETTTIINPLTIDLSTQDIVQLKCYVKSLGSSNNLITSNPALNEVAYYSIPPQDKAQPRQLLTSTSLCEVWSFYLINATLQDPAPQIKPQKSRYVVFPHGKTFPDVPQRIQRKFWHSEVLTLPESGYLYAYDLLEGTTPVVFTKKKLPRSKEKKTLKSQKPLTTAIPSAWHSEMHFLFYVKCLRPTNSEGSLKVQLEVELKSRETNRASSEPAVKQHRSGGEAKAPKSPEHLTKAIPQDESPPLGTPVDREELSDISPVERTPHETLTIQQKETRAANDVDHKVTLPKADIEKSCELGASDQQSLQHSKPSMPQQGDDWATITEDEYSEVQDKVLTSDKEEGKETGSEEAEKATEGWLQNIGGAFGKGFKDIVKGAASMGKEFVDGVGRQIGGIKEVVSGKKKAIQLKPKVIKREKEIKLQHVGTYTEDVILISRVPLRNLEDCSLTVVLTGEHCECEEIGLFVRYT